METNN